MKTFALILALACAAAAQADRSLTQQQQCSISDSIRYQIVQPHGAKVTLKLDRYMPSVWRLVESEDAPKWQRVQVIDAPRVTTEVPRFQLFTSGASARFTFLLDTLRGTTWVLAESESTATFVTMDEIQ